MDLKIECLKCGSRIDITKQIADLVTEEGHKEASRILSEEHSRNQEQTRQAIEQATKKGREQERSEQLKVNQAAISRITKDKEALQGQVEVSPFPRTRG